MTVSQSERTKSQTAEEIREKRAFLLTFIAGVLTLAAGIVLRLISGSEMSPYSFQAIMGSAIMQLVGAFLIRRRRVIPGLIIFFFAALPTILYVTSQNTNIGILATVGTLIIYVMVLPQVLANTRQIVWAQISAFVIAALLVLTDLYWPVARPQVSETIFNLTAVIFVSLLLIFAYITLKQFPAFSLRGKLVSTTLVVAVIAVLLVAFGVTSLTRRALTAEVGDNLQVLAQSQALAIGELLAREINTLEALSLNRILQDGAQASNETYTGGAAQIEASLLEMDTRWQTASGSGVAQFLNNEMASELLKFRQTFPENAEIFITDRYGALLAATNRTSDFYQADEEWWQVAFNGGQGSVYVGSPAFDASSSTTGIQIAIPMFAHSSSGSSEVVGIVRTTFQLDTLSDVLFNARFEETGQVELYLPDGRQLAALENDLFVLTPFKLDEATLAELQDPSTGSLNVAYDGFPNLVTMAPVTTLTNESGIDALGWNVLIRQANSESLAPILEQQRFNAVLGILVIIFAGGTAAFVGQRLTVPILRLTEAAEQAAAGNFNVSIPVETQDEIGTLANALNVMTAHVRESISNLEERVQARTRALETSIDVGRRLSTILDSQQLVEAVVNQVREAFNYYHVHIYLLDKDKELLVMVGGTGAAGQEMLARGHKLALGQGLVGQAAFSNQVVLVPDVAQVKEWLPNPLLPETKAEVAVPIVLGNQVLGVLDVQQNVTNSLQQADVDVLLSITNQVAIALENARLLENFQKQVGVEAQINSIGQQIRETTSVEDALQIAIRELGRVTQAKQTTVQLVANGTAANGDLK